MQVQEHVEGILPSSMQDDVKPRKLLSPSSQQALVGRFGLSPLLQCNPAEWPRVSSMAYHSIWQGRFQSHRH